MSRSDNIDKYARRRILDNTHKKKWQGGQEDHSETVDVERLLARPVSVGRSKRKARKRHKTSGFGLAVLKILVLAVVVIGGILVVIGLRDLATQFGIVWIGE